MEDLTLAVHCFCVCSGSALLGDLLGVSRSVERELSVCPVDLSYEFLACIHCVSTLSISLCVIMPPPLGRGH